MKKACILVLIALTGTACSTMNESLKLGGGVGAGAGAAATYTAHESVGRTPSLENVALGAGIGLVGGLITSYFVHKQVDQDRKDMQADQTEMYFGDLPPNPFIVPKPTRKRGGR